MENEKSKKVDEDCCSQKSTKMKGGRKTNTGTYVQFAIIGLLLLVIGFNAGRIADGGSITGAVTGLGTVSASEIIPAGIPAIYGSELDVSYDDVSPTNAQSANLAIAKLKKIDTTVTLEGAQLTRYIGITTKISCEYCCGADSIVFDDGRAACGCAHSYAMRGLAKYLISEHGDEYSDEEILAELGKWKVLFFPGIHEQKAAALEAQGIDSTDYINLASNAYRGIEKGQASGSSGGMVGGC